MKINGFEIDKFNQYNLPENAKQSTCPLCSHTRKKSKDKCMRLHWDTGIGVCYHCGEMVQLHTFKKKEKEQPKVYKKPEWKNKTELSNNLVKWFEKRGISQTTLKLAKVSEGAEWMPQVNKEVNTVQFNYFREGELINIKFRDGAKHFKLVKDAERILYNLDCVKHDTSMIIVEGEMDALSFMEAGHFNVVSVPNGSQLGNVNLDYIDNCIEYFENKEKIYLALDNDEAGENVTKELIRRVGSEKCFKIDFEDFKDANEYLIAKGVESLSHRIKIAKLVPIDGVSSINDWRSEFEDYIANGMKQGYKIGKKGFDDIFSTYTGQYIVVTGIPSSGKSDFVDEMCIGYNINYNWKIAYASPENKPNKIHAGKLISKFCGQWVTGGEAINKLWFKQAANYIHDNFKFIDLDTYDLDLVLSKAKDMIFRYGIKVLVIDPFNKVRLRESLNKNTNDYTNDYLVKIDEFARQNDILILLVAHPVKPSGDERKTYEPSFYSIKGGGEFYDMSPHGILVHRDYENELVKVKVLKVKFNHLGENNKWVWLKWNKSNGRYIDFQYQHEKPENISTPLVDNSNWFIEQENNINQQDFEFVGHEMPSDFFTVDPNLPF